MGSEIGATYKGVRLESLGIYILNRKLPRHPNFHHQGINISGRAGMRIFGTEFKEREISIECVVTDQSLSNLSQKERNQIAVLFNPLEDGWLIFDDDPSVGWYCRPADPISVAQKISSGVFNITFVCSEKPWTYGIQEKIEEWVVTNTPYQIQIVQEGTIPEPLVMEIEGVSVSGLSVQNLDLYFRGKNLLNNTDFLDRDSPTNIKKWVQYESTNPVRYDSLRVGPQGQPVVFFNDRFTNMGMGLSQTVPAIPGDVYTFSCLHKSEGGDGLKLYFYFYNSSGNVISSNSRQLSGDASDWTRRSITTPVAPAGTVNVKVLIYSDISFINKAWICEPQLERGSKMTEYQKISGKDHNWYNGTISWAGTLADRDILYIETERYLVEKNGQPSLTGLEVFPYLRPGENTILIYSNGTNSSKNMIVRIKRRGVWM